MEKVSKTFNLEERTAKETKHWLRMLHVHLPDESDFIKKLWKEAQELTLIFQKITSTLKKDN